MTGGLPRYPWLTDRSLTRRFKAVVGVGGISLFSQEDSFPLSVEGKRSPDGPLSVSEVPWLPQGIPPVWGNRKALGFPVGSRL